jgi:hypothetical protein
VPDCSDDWPLSSLAAIHAKPTIEPSYPTLINEYPQVDARRIAGGVALLEVRC